jgi:D-sedoheptulose 7-phosphate isomerase
MTKPLQEHSEKLRLALEDMSEFHDQVVAVAEQLKEAFKNGKKVLVAGNGGSAAEAQHLSDEMVGRYKKDRPAYPVIALTSDGAVLTCIGNDYGYDNVFKRQVEALGKEGDIFIGLTTSGTSKNILVAAEQARAQGMTVIAFCGQTGPFAEQADYAIKSPSDTPSIVQELHLHAIHSLCELFEDGVDYKEVMETGDPALLL